MNNLKKILSMTCLLGVLSGIVVLDIGAIKNNRTMIYTGETISILSATAVLLSTRDYNEKREIKYNKK